MSKKKENEKGFTYIDVMCGMVILLVGIAAQVSALSYSILRQREAEQKNTARQIASSTLESIFAARDLGGASGLNNWDAINTSDKSSSGIFVADWNPVRQNPGKDGIQGTKDDACAATSPCLADSYSNNSPLISGFQRQIIISDIPETGSNTIKKRRLEVKIRYFVGQAQREETLATAIADLPFYK